MPLWYSWTNLVYKLTLVLCLVVVRVTLLWESLNTDADTGAELTMVTWYLSVSCHTSPQPSQQNWSASTLQHTETISFINQVNIVWKRLWNGLSVIAVFNILCLDHVTAHKSDSSSFIHELHWSSVYSPATFDHCLTHSSLSSPSLSTSLWSRCRWPGAAESGCVYQCMKLTVLHSALQADWLREQQFHSWIQNHSLQQQQPGSQCFAALARQARLRWAPTHCVQHCLSLASSHTVSAPVSALSLNTATLSRLPHLYLPPPHSLLTRNTYNKLLESTHIFQFRNIFSHFPHIENLFKDNCLQSFIWNNVLIFLKYW